MLVLTAAAISDTAATPAPMMVAASTAERLNTSDPNLFGRGFRYRRVDWLVVDVVVPGQRNEAKKEEDRTRIESSQPTTRLLSSLAARSTFITSRGRTAMFSALSAGLRTV